jgi:hypothetical protein
MRAADKHVACRSMFQGFVLGGGHRDTAHVRRVRRPRLLWPLVAIALGVAVTGCGSTAPLTHAQLASRANALCTQLHDKMKRLGPAKTANALAQTAHELAGFEQQQLEAMRKLRPPASLASDWKQLVEGAEEIAEAAGTLSTDIQLKKDKAASAAFQQVGKVEQRIKPVVERDGFASCKELA